jgi:GNAT superfamily N-acetyltransferase
MSLTIREATPKDARDLARLYRQLDRSAVVEVSTIERLLEEIGRYPSYRAFVAEQDGAVVGTYLLLIVPTFGSRCKPAAVVEDVVVDSELRNAGIGRAMMTHAMGEARAAGCYKLALSSNVARTDAHRFYESLGFSRHGYSFRLDL